MHEIARVPVADAWLGLDVFAGWQARVCRRRLARHGLRIHVLRDGRTEAGARIRGRSPEAQRSAQDFIGDVAVSPDGRLIYAADLYHDSIVVIDAQSGRVIERYQNRPPAVSDFVSSRRKIVFRFELGGWDGVSARCRER